MRLDEEKLEALRAWGLGLRQAEGVELAATGRAILMLVEEIDRLHVELWHARLRVSEPDPEPVEQPAQGEEPVEPALQGRLRRVLRRNSEPVKESRSEPESGDQSTAAQYWIESLRRQS
jgi:hypothetical protein